MQIIRLKQYNRDFFSSHATRLGECFNTADLLEMGVLQYGQPKAVFFLFIYRTTSDEENSKIIQKGWSFKSAARLGGGLSIRSVVYGGSTSHVVQIEKNLYKSKACQTIDKNLGKITHSHTSKIHFQSIFSGGISNIFRF